MIRLPHGKLIHGKGDPPFPRIIAFLTPQRRIYFMSLPYRML